MPKQYVKILHSGKYNGVAYTKGQVWQVITYVSPSMPTVRREGKETNLWMTGTHPEGEYTDSSSEEPNYEIF